MTRDFAKNRQFNAKQEAKRGKKSANQGRATANKNRATTKKGNGASRSQPSSGLPGWLWLITGALLGAFVMFLIYLADLPAQPVVDIQPEIATQPEPSLPKPRFDFYKLLQESEVVVDAPPIEAKDQASASVEYILQVGSFRNDADADRMRAELILINLNAEVEQVKVRNGETWHRVLVGPYTDRSKLAKARSILASNNISPLLLKRERP